MTRAHVYVAAVGTFVILVGFFQSWSVALTMLNLGLISAIMALGVNIQWGYAGLFNVGIMGFAAIGGLMALLVSHPPVAGAIAVGGSGLAIAFAVALGTLAAAVLAWRWLSGMRCAVVVAILLCAGYALFRALFNPAVAAIETFEPSSAGFLGGFGQPILFGWVAGGLAAAAAAFIVGRIALSLRADYLAIATLGISEIIVAVLKNEDWLTRGVKNATGLPRPVPDERLLVAEPWFRSLIERLNSGALDSISDPASRADALGQMATNAAPIIVKLCYAGLFSAVLALLFVLSALALRSPWGRMVRAIRDNEIAASAMGKNVGARHLQILILGSAIVGIAGAMLVTYEGQFAPTAYTPLRFTFLIWVMVVVGGSGNNLGSVIGAFLIWFLWVQSEALGVWFMDFATAWLPDASPIRVHLMQQAQHMRLFLMGAALLVIMRFSPGGLLPERSQA